MVIKWNLSCKQTVDNERNRIGDIQFQNSTSGHLSMHVCTTSAFFGMNLSVDLHHLTNLPVRQISEEFLLASIVSSSRSRGDFSYCSLPCTRIEGYRTRDGQTIAWLQLTAYSFLNKKCRCEKSLGDNLLFTDCTAYVLCEAVMQQIS